jgi:hypothetical protein
MSSRGVIGFGPSSNILQKLGDNVETQPLLREA